MRSLAKTCLTALFLAILAGCAHPMTRLKNINLGMTPADVETEMGKPYAVRSAKLFKGEQTTEVWEYWPPYFSNNAQKVWVIFENGRVVQWGAPGDYSTGSASSVKEYSEQKGR
jgi:hypothetical protein